MIAGWLITKPQGPWYYVVPLVNSPFGLGESRPALFASSIHAARALVPGKVAQGPWHPSQSHVVEAYYTVRTCWGLSLTEEKTIQHHPESNNPDHIDALRSHVEHDEPVLLVVQDVSHVTATVEPEPYGPDAFCGFCEANIPDREALVQHADAACIQIAR